MDSDKIIKDQVMSRAMKEPYMATEIVGNNCSAIFGNDIERNTIARTIARYYYHHKQKLTKATLDKLLADRVKILARNNQIKSDQQAIKYFKDANNYLSGKVDTSDKMTQMVSHFVKRKLASFAILNAGAEYQSNPETFDLVGKTTKALAKINSLDITGQGNQIIDVFDKADFKKEHEAFQELNKDKIPTGLANLDQATYQGLAKGEMGLIGASSGQGKTTFLSNLSISYVKEGFNVLHVSLEELASQMLLRFARISLGVTPETLFDGSGHLSKKTEKYIYKRYISASASGKLGTLSFYRTSPRTLTVDGLRQLIESAERLKHIKYDVVVLDYPDLLLNAYHTDSESLNGGRMFQDLRKLAQDEDVVLWTATQMNRMASQQDVKSMSSIEGSYRKINTVEFAGTINRTQQEWTHGFMRLKIDKLRNRMNFAGTCLYFKYDPPTMQIRPDTSDELKQQEQLLNEDSSDNKMSFRNNRSKSSSVESKQARIRKINQWNNEMN